MIRRRAESLPNIIKILAIISVSLVASMVLSTETSVAERPIDPVWGTQPYPAEIVVVFNRARINLLGSEGPTYPKIYSGYPNPTPVSPYIPSIVLKAIGYTESTGWKQFEADYGQQGPTVISPDYGYGIMQITSGMDGSGGFDPNRVASEYVYNIGTGAKILIGKWNGLNNYIGENDPEVIEDWYYAVWRYNGGWPWDNNPNNPIYPDRPPFDGSQDRKNYPYQELVWGYAANSPGSEFWQSIRLTLPDRNDIGNVPPEWVLRPSPSHTELPFEIKEPTQPHPANAGPKDNPKDKLDVKIRINIHGLNKDSFSVQIGGKTANIIDTPAELSDNYVFKVTPPSQDANGLYGLTVSVGSGSVTEIDAIRYSPEAANVDTVLIIDRSGSMGSYGYIDSAKNAAKQFVDLMSNGDQVAVVSFSGDARVDFSLSLITSSNVKEQAKSTIDSLDAYGSTSIGDGLQTGQDQLTSNGISEHPWAMILLSDGYENTSAWVADVLPTIPEKTDIYTIALGSYSDEGLLQDIATETGGQYYFSPTSGQLQEIYSLIGGQIAGEQTITSKSGTVNEGETNIETAIIDSLVSLVTFLVSWSGSDIDLTLTDPNGLVIDPNVASTDPDISFTSGSTYEYYTIDSPNPGEWRINIEGVDTPWAGENYTARVTGKSDLTLSIYFGKDRYETGQPITVLASLSDASDPITGATIEVVLQVPSQSLSAWKSVNGDTIPTEPLGQSVSTLKSLYKESLNIRLPSQQSSSSPVFYLYDDGAHGDGQANDSVYGNLYTSTSNSGSYIFNFEASGTTNTGDPFTRITQHSLFVAQATATGSISGTISYSGSQVGSVYIQAWQNDPTMYGNPDYLTSISSPGPYVLSNLPDNTYYLTSYMDSDGNGIRDENEPRGVYGLPHKPNNVIVSGGSQTSNIDIILIEGVISYPNPCYLNRGQTVKIANLPLNSKVYIYTISGELVRTLDDASEISVGGSSTTAFWDCKNDAGEEVARGIYIYLATDNIGTKRTGKIAIIK